MPRFGLCGPSYQSQSLNADAQRIINWYLEQIESGQGQTSFALYPCAGTKVFCDLGGTSTRDQFIVNGRMFVVNGVNLYEIFADGTFILRNPDNPMIDDGNSASMTASPLQLLIASGGQPYVLTLKDNTFQAVDGALGYIKQVAFSDGYFLLLLGNSQKVQFSALEDATSLSALDVFQVSLFTENLVGMLVSHRELWLFGGGHTVVYYDSGDANNPWQPVPSGFIEQGLAAYGAKSLLDNSPFWLGTSERGEIMAYRANGYLGQRISNHAIESEWSQYPKISDAMSYAWSDRGHSFWQITFPSARKGLGATWVYDVATGQWHERGYLRQEQ